MMSARDEDAPQSGDRRQVPRVAATIPVRVVAHDGRRWEGSSIDLGRFGLRLDVSTGIEPGHIAWLWLDLPDGAPPMRALGLLVRDDPHGQAFFFVIGGRPEATRLDQFIASCEPCGCATSPGSG
jgi:hypothetical protein